MTNKHLRLRYIVGLLFILFVGFSLASSKGDVENSRWSPACDETRGISFARKNTADLEVNFDQIHIRIKIARTKTGFDVRLGEPLDLGSGGMRLDWDHFSKSRPIAQIFMNSEDRFTLHWIGFYDDKEKKAVWTNEPDFVVAGLSSFYRCADSSSN